MEDERETTQPERRVVTVNEAASILRISRGSAYEAAKRKEIPTIRIGRRLLVPVAALEIPELSDWRRRDAIECLCGPYAQRKACPRSNWRVGGGVSRRRRVHDLPKIHAGTDFAQVKQIIEQEFQFRSERVRDAYYAYLVALAMELVENYAGEILSVATALLKRKTLRGYEVREAMGGRFVYGDPLQSEYDDADANEEAKS